MKWQTIVIILLIIAGGGVAVYQVTRGIRNKNPGNIRFTTANNWNGQTGQDAQGFVIFSDASFGIRAIGKTIDSYQRRGVLSIRDIISTWAPNVENNTESYIKSVVNQMDVHSDQFIPARSEGDFLTLVKGIIRHENGLNPYTDEEIVQGLNS